MICQRLLDGPHARSAAILLACSALLLTACGGGNGASGHGPARADTVSAPAQVSRIVGIGKVEPRDGIIDLAAGAGGIVETVKAQAGDTLAKGDTILVLEHADAALRVQQLEDELKTQQEQIASDRIDTRQYQAKLDEKAAQLEASERLVKTGAETAEHVRAQQTDKRVLEVQLEKSRKAVSLGLSKRNEMDAELKTAKHKLQEKTRVAPEAGTLLSITAKQGAAVQPLSAFATFAPQGPLVVRGEVDEMFAGKIAPGQMASIKYVGDSATVCKGKVIFIAPLLTNKSLFIDVPGEQQDRRVRQFKVLPEHPGSLLINDKVECIIQLDKGDQ